MIPNNPDLMREDLREAARSDSAAYDAATEAQRAAEQDEPFDPVEVARQIREMDVRLQGLPKDRIKAIADAIREMN